MKASKKPWYILIFLIWGLFIGFLYWLTRDEPLSKEAEQLLSNVQLYDVSLNEHPYFDVLGFDARSDADQQILGYLKYQEGWAEFFHHFFDVDREQISQPSKKLEGIFFSDNEAKSLDLILKASKQGLRYQDYQRHRAALMSTFYKNKNLKQRYERLLKQSSSENILLLSINGVIPNFIVIMKVHHLYLSHLAFNNDVEAIVQYTNILTGKMENAPLVDKMVYLSMVSNNLDILNDLLILNPKLKINVKRLNYQQLSVRKALSAEVASISVMLDRVNKHENLANFYGFLHEKRQSETSNNWIKNKIVHLFFLKNTSLNIYVEDIYPAIHLSELSNINLIKTLRNKKEVRVKKTGLKNYLGEYIIDVAMPNWKIYALRPRLLDQKIQILNILSNDRRFDLKQLNQNTEGYKYYRTETELCIKSPNPHQDKEQWEQYKSCLKI